APPPGYPEDSWDEPREYVRVEQGGQPAAWREWLAALSPTAQVGYGCILVMIMSAVMVYCVGAATFFVRPMLVERAAMTPTEVTRPTLVPTPTQFVEPTTFIQLPKGTLVATPTQAPIPPRDSFLVTPPPDIIDRLTQTPQASPIPGPSPTRKPGVTALPTSRP
ncbi:MAG TPA: hypothetical protein VF932_13710, partial [Anaerolineae bacterium]